MYEGSELAVLDGSELAVFDGSMQAVMDGSELAVLLVCSKLAVLGRLAMISS